MSLYYVGMVVYWLCRLYILVLLVRVVFDAIQIFKRDWMPQGIVLLIASITYRLTDPPLRFLSRYIPPLRLGMVALDVGFIVLFFAVKILQTVSQFLILSSLG